MKSKILIIIALGLFMLIGASGCQYLKKRVEKKEKTEYRLTSTGKFRIEIENVNGNVDVIPTADTTGLIYITAEKIGKVKINDQDKPIEGVDIKIDTTDEIIKVSTEYKKPSFSIFEGKNRATVNYTVKIPASLKVVVNSTNGTISAGKLQADSRFENVNGSIYINGCTGTLDIETVNGSIKANIDSTKGLIAETVNGSIDIGNLKNADANVEASCVNGKVKVENLNFSSVTSQKKNLSGQLGNGKNIIRLSTINGSIHLDGNYVSFSKKNKGDFDFKFEFDENDEPVKIEVKHTDEQKGEVTKTDTTKAKDSVKNK
ncbi:MAG TPA: hypothetical protein VGK25_09195 [Ignavibacteria bacterium]|jgi:hypothetical protein